MTPVKFMTLPFSNWQFVLLTSKVDEKMPVRGRENTQEEIFLWENSTQKSSIKDCKTLTGIWILFLLKNKRQSQNDQGIWKIISRLNADPLWDEKSHLNAQSICWYLEKNLGDSRI
jgi:hypothetical protein